MNKSLDQVTACASTVPRNARFHVVPRYSGGSPAMVSEEIAMRVAVQEVESYEMALTGAVGQQEEAKAAKEGLSWIAYARWEKGRKLFRLDLITGEQITEPPRLEDKDIKRLKLLRNSKKYGLMRFDENELTGLEFRAKIHRQEIT